MHVVEYTIWMIFNRQLFGGRLLVFTLHQRHLCGPRFKSHIFIQQQLQDLTEYINSLFTEAESLDRDNRTVS